MYALLNEATGKWAMGRHGRFTYGTYDLALTAARILGKRDQCRYRAVPA